MTGIHREESDIRLEHQHSCVEAEASLIFYFLHEERIRSCQKTRIYSTFLLFTTRVAHGQLVVVTWVMACVVTMLTNWNVLINEQHSSNVHAGTPSPHEKPKTS